MTNIPDLPARLRTLTERKCDAAGSMDEQVHPIAAEAAAWIECWNEERKGMVEAIMNVLTFEQGLSEGARKALRDAIIRRPW